MERHCGPHPKADHLRLFIEQTLGIHRAVELRGEDLVRIPINLDPEAPVAPEDLKISVDRPKIDPEKLRRFLKERELKKDRVEDLHFQVESFLLGLRRQCANLSDTAVREFLLAPLSSAPRTLDDSKSPKPLFSAHLDTIGKALNSLLSELEETVQRIRTEDMKVRLATPPPEVKDFLFAQRKILQAFRKFLEDSSQVE